MVGIAAMGGHSRVEDWRIIAFGLFFFYVLLYPAYALYIRFRHTHRIKRQVVTTIYKVPQKFTPAEFAYIFSTKVKKPQIYATLLELANQSVVLLHKQGEEVIIELGPKLTNNLKMHELLLLKQIYKSGGKLSFNSLVTGESSYGLTDGKVLHGSKQYIFWWLLRNGMQKNGYIYKWPAKRYVRLIAKYGFLWSLLIATFSLVSIRIYEMLDSGNLNGITLVHSIESILLFWLLLVPPVIVVSFFVLRFHGRMLGRSWLLTSKSHRYMLQMESFREFVRLTARNRLHFESEQLKKEAIAQTKPYAIALGYEKLP